MTLYYAGQRLAAADLNPIMAKYKNASVQSGIVTTTNTTVTVPTLVYNKGGGIVTAASSVLTLNKTGVWRFKGNVQFEANTAGWYVWIGHPTNVAAVDRYTLSTLTNRNGISAVNVSGEKEMTSGDQIALRMWHNKGSNAATLVSELETWLSVEYVHGT